MSGCTCLWPDLNLFYIHSKFSNEMLWSKGLTIYWSLSSLFGWQFWFPFPLSLWFCIRSGQPCSVWSEPVQWGQWSTVTMAKLGSRAQYLTVSQEKRCRCSASDTIRQQKHKMLRQVLPFLYLIITVNCQCTCAGTKNICGNSRVKVAGIWFWVLTGGIDSVFGIGTWV